MRGAPKYRWVRYGWLVLVLARCLPPHGDTDLPSTGVAGVERGAVLRLLAPPGVRRVGAVVPITVEATFSGPKALAAEYCVRLAGEPGTLEFPFGDQCGPGDAGAPAMAAEAAVTASFSRTHACLRPQPTAAGQQGATLIAAYLPHGEETAATLFGALYDNARCNGEPIVSTALLLELRGTTGGGDVEPADGGAPDSGSSDGGSDAAPDAGPVPEPDSGPDGSAPDSGSDDAGGNPT